MENDNYEYPYGDAQVHEALADLDRRLRVLESKSGEPAPVPPVDDQPAVDALAAQVEAIAAKIPA